MLDWERRAIGVQLGDAPHFVGTLSATYDPGRDTTGTAWWVTAFFAPEVWRRWGVGLLHGSLNLWLTASDGRVEIPGLQVKLPEEVLRQIQPGHPDLARRWRQVSITPVLVAGEALGFVIRGSETPDTFVEVFAPTHLRTRLGIARNQKTPVQVGVLACDY